MKAIFTLLSLLVSPFIFGQASGTISVFVVSENNIPLEDVNVELRMGKDSSLVKVAITDRKGIAQFENIAYGAYFLKSSIVGYSNSYSQALIISSETPGALHSTIKLLKKTISLEEISVNNKRPFIQKLSDRIVVNVDNSIVNAGSTAMDVLERSPGVTVDQNDIISLRGRQGVIIMIDGKPSPMTGADLTTYLKALPSNVIDRIDLITNPSAKYDAAGNSGIIDIHMKKDVRLGANGTLTAGVGQGVFTKANSGISLNYRNKKVNVFGNYNYGYRKGLNHLILDRNFYDNNVFSGEDKKDNYTKIPSNSHTLRAGMDFFPSKKTIVGFIVNGNFNTNSRTNDNSSVVINSQKQPIYTFKAFSNDHGYQENIFANLNLKHAFDSTGRELTADVDYGTFVSGSLSSTGTKYYNLNGGSQQPDYILDGDQGGKLTIRTAKLDYKSPLPSGIKLETGFKTSYVSSDNDAQFFDLSSGFPVRDVSKTNHFFYDEYNNSGYLNFNKEFKKWNITFGIRGEHTKIKTRQVMGDIKFDSNYFKLFPSAFLNYKLKEDQTIGFSISRRIDRPGYSQLNPFLFLIDVSTYATGNPGLLPQFTWSYELSYTLKSLNFSTSYSHTIHDQNIAIAKFKDVFPNLASADNVTVQIPVNLTTSDYFGFTASVPLKIKKWWNMINNGNVYYQHYNGSLGNTILSNGKPAFDIRSDNSFTLAKGWSAELNGSYNSGGQYGFMVANGQWGVSAGIQKLVLKNKGTLRFNITDIFWTNLPSGTITYNNYKEYWKARRETRVGSLNFTYRFGKNTIQGARRRTTSSEEERNRAGN